MPYRVRLAGAWHYTALPAGEPSHSFCGLDLMEGSWQRGEFAPHRNDCGSCASAYCEILGLTSPRYEQMRRALAEIDRLVRGGPQPPEPE